MDWHTPEPNTSFSPGGGDVLFAGQTLMEGSALEDVEDGYFLEVYEGYLELLTLPTSTSGEKLIWWAGSGCDGTAAATMQSDGNLVLKCNGAETWSSGTGGHPASYGFWLHLQYDGNLVIYSNWGVAEWSTGT